MTDRIGFWIDMDDAYVTYSNEYIETGWWIFKRLWDNDLVFQDFRVTPHCPRCQTSLSSHEIAQGYEDDTPDPGVTLRFRLPSDAPAADSLRLGDDVPTSLLAWTTTPWTLSGNTALAVSLDAEYALVEVAREEEPVERVVLASALVGSVVGEEGTVLGTLPGADLLGLEYEPLYPQSVEWVEPLVFVEGRSQRVKDGDALPARRVIASEEVTTEEGTGILHVAPAFGEADYVMGRAEGLMFLQPVRSDGAMIGGPADGVFAKTADPTISDDLRERGLLFKAETIRHTYPFCWRCGTPVLYYAKPSWYIRTTAVGEKLVEHNQQINWVPENIKNGRFGEWLEGNVDWAVSRERYWGTPLPLWVCEICEHRECIGSFEELRERARPGTTDALETEHGFDAHRPFVDSVQLDCPRCNGTMRRTPEVADGWFDSGAMPYAQWHYPFENEALFDERFPADFICEAVDQTRGWFYTLHALATLLHRTEDVPEGISYRNVISLGHILDGDGQKMSKSKGNVVDPWTVLDHHGADATRWYMYTASPPGNARRFSEDLVAETTRRFLSTLWNTYSFFVTYANLADFDPSSAASADEEPTELDRWVRSELHRTVQQVTEGLEAYELSDAARPIERFVEGLSNWYVRRSRRRFWRSGDDADSRVALRTLYECLSTVSKLLAPFTPFVAESLHRNLAAGHVDGAADSVHLEVWPAVDEAAIDETLSEEMEAVQRMVSLGRAARSSAQVRVRQPLGTAAMIPRTAAERAALKRLAPLIADELNVKSVDILDDGGERVSYTLRPNLPVLGPKFGKEVGKIRGVLGNADAAPIVRAMRAGEAINLEGFELGGGDILVGVEATDGWAAAEDGGYVALLDTTITEELRSEGLARELVRRLQDLRRESGLDVSDRIDVRYASDSPGVVQAFEAHGAYIAEETLALGIEAGDEASWDSTDAKIDDLEVTLALRKAEAS
jgi:isoleucyl-tRNA synthetase